MLVGTGRFELPTCRLGGGRSIQLSYVPTDWTFSHDCIRRSTLNLRFGDFGLLFSGMQIVGS